MFAAKAPKGNTAAKPRERSGLQSQIPVNSKDKLVEDSILPRTLSRDTSFAAPFGTDSERSWAPLTGDTINENESRHIMEFGGNSIIDEDSIYSKNERTLVAYFGPLPREVESALNKTDFYTQPMTAKMDLDSGFGIVISQTKCYIWAVQKDATYRSPPMCIALPMPPNSNTSPDKSVLLPAVTITKSDDQHSGVLACSPDGTCWYWNDIDLSLSNVDQHTDTKINLVQDDYISHVECAGPMGYYLGTRYANVYQASIRKQFGSVALTSAQLPGKSGGAIASIFNMIGVMQGPDTSQKITSMTSGPRIQDPHGRWDLFVMTRRSLFRWHLYRSGECTMESEVTLREQITERILRDYSATLPMGSDPRVRLLDIEYTKNGKLLVLATFFDTAIKTAASPLSCALFTLSPQFGTTIDIESVKYIQRSVEEDLRPEASPKLVVPHGGPGVFIIMPKAVIITSSLPNFEFEDLVPLKNDRIIGFGTEEWKQRGQELGDSSELSIVCRTSGRLGIHIHLDGVSTPSFSSDDPRATQGLLTAQLQAKLEQAVFFGGKKNNPISFDLTHYDGGDLNQASLNVSREILNSHATLLNSGKDLTARLSERYQKTKDIIESIRAAGMASRLSIDTRFKLCWSAEKLAAANALWTQYQLKLAATDKNKAPKTNLKPVMDDAAAESLEKIRAHATEDSISFFLKYHVDSLAELLSHLQSSARKLSLVSAGQQAELTRDINRILVLSLRSAWSYRKQHVEIYALKNNSSIEPWTATEDVIKALTAQYMATLSICKSDRESGIDAMDMDDRGGAGGSSHLSSELKDQLCDLADVTLQAHSERLQYLEGLSQTSSHNIAIAAAVNTYDEAKLELLTPLVELKKTQSAVQLAQRYRDFTTLVKLSIGQERQITSYIAKYQQEFANALFQWYYDNDQLPTLLDVGEKYSDLFTVYLDSRDYSEIAWLHDIKIRRYVVASQRIQDGAVLEMNVDRRRTMFSLSKLLFLAGLPQQEQQQEGGINAENMMKYASRNNEELEMATIQAYVADEWEKHVGALASVDEKVQAVLKEFKLSVLGQQPMLREALLKSAQSLLNRQAISSEDLLDVLMTQQKPEIANIDVCDASLGICLHAADIPENRRPYVLQDIWRRIFIAGEDGYWKLEEVSDLEARERLLSSWMGRAYAVIYRAEGHKDELLLRPEDAKCSMPTELFRERFMSEGGSSGAQKNIEAMIKDYERENRELEKRIREGQLLQKWSRVKEIVKEEAARAASAGADPSYMQDVEMSESFA
ncbi:hypothetical protein BC939DRAFT_506537 [Gamsiella multidivaricata]|uniref:uncharacterized protein n=1 Tax=Gamsiella multidivaricata TaxID=101098 RepID=UPI00221E9B53|nr:uncharacterized protein BC939DRAFT_506537 [Gamsiella multidivaricata]KAG0367944.1 hypothetical protein BGZ54_002975 [Gamsiella multidivaricata]KAI7818463.1 hypothetical protein BC939DRAFT_506537 [Gamsiella multidivaricata]